MDPIFGDWSLWSNEGSLAFARTRHRPWSSMLYSTALLGLSVLVEVIIWCLVTFIEFISLWSNEWKPMETAFSVLLLFAFACRVSAKFCNRTAGIELTAIETIGALTYLALSANRGLPAQIRSYFSLVLCSFRVFRYVLRAVLYNSRIATSIFSQWSANNGPAKIRLVETWESSQEVPHNFEPEVETADELSNQEPLIYAPRETVPLGRALPPTQSQQEELSRYPHFARCGCCLDEMRIVRRDRLHDIEGIATKRSKGYYKWLEERNEFVEGMQNNLSSNSYGLSDNARTSVTEQFHLCEACESVWSKLRGKSYPYHPAIYEHAANPVELQASARNNCHFCTMIWESLNYQQQEELLLGDFNTQHELDRRVQALPDPTQRELVREQFHLRRCICLHIYRRSITPHFGNHRVPRAWSNMYHSLSSNIFLADRLGSEAISPLSLEQESIKATALDLVGTYTGDQTAEFLISRVLRLRAVPDRPDWIPTRLVDVSQSFGGTVRVRTSEEISTRAGRTQYVALSHCWGKKWMITYRSNTKSELDKGIDVWKLTRTFREAIEITRRLGFNYIWIDSLCILQDDYDDWEREGSAMAKVYGCAAFTIAAVASRDGEGGLFRDMSPLALAKCPLTTYTYKHTTYGSKGKPRTERQEMRIYARPLPERTYDDMKFDDILQSKWNRRGWMLQERILSKKIVYFGNRGLYFEQRDRNSGLSLATIHFQTEYPITLSHGERLICGPDPFRRLKTPNKPISRRFSWRAFKWKEPDCTVELFHDHWHTKWWQWVMNFTNRELTKSMDRPKAVEGLRDYVITEQAYRDQPPQYVFGLWEEHLVCGLLWYVSRNCRTKRQEYYAPSWSWTSVEGVVRNESLSLAPSKTNLEVIKVCRGDTPSAFAATPSYLVLRGRTRNCVWSRSPNMGSHYYVARRQLDETGHFQHWEKAGVPVASKSKVGPICYPLYPESQSLEPIGWFLPDTTDLDAMPDELTCLYVNVQPEEIDKKIICPSMFATRGLVLEPIGPTFEASNNLDSPSDTPLQGYRRIGYFELDIVHRGVYYDSKPGQCSFNVIHIPPDTDPTKLFMDCQTSLFRLY